MTIFYTSEKLNVRILTSKTLIERHLFLFYQSECIFFGENSEKEIQGLKFKKKIFNFGRKYLQNKTIYIMNKIG